MVEPVVCAVIEEREFEGSVSSVGDARSFVVAAVRPDPPTAEVLRLVVSELATNAVLHAGGSYTVRVVARPEIVRVEVVDRSPVIPVARPQPPRSVAGRGLAIVERLAARWGVTPEPTGKRVWFELSPTP